MLTLPEPQGAKIPEGILKRQSNQGDLETRAPKRCKVRDPHLPCPLPAALGWRRGRFHIWKVLLCCEAQPRGARRSWRRSREGEGKGKGGGTGLAGLGGRASMPATTPWGQPC